MTLNIEISDKYRITSDNTQVIVQRKHIVDPTLSPNFKPGMDATKRTEWRDWKWCSDVTHEIDVIRRQNVFESDATSLEQLCNEITAIKREIRRLIGEDDLL